MLNALEVHKCQAGYKKLLAIAVVRSFQVRGSFGHGFEQLHAYVFARFAIG